MNIDIACPKEIKYFDFLKTDYIKCYLCKNVFSTSETGLQQIITALSAIAMFRRNIDDDVHFLNFHAATETTRRFTAGPNIIRAKFDTQRTSDAVWDSL